MKLLNLRDFHYELPPELIAQQPLTDRSASRLLVYEPYVGISHRSFQDLPQLLPRGTHLVYNDTRVLPGRLIASTIHGGRIELMLLNPINTARNSWQALGRPFRKLSPGTKLQLAGGCSATILQQHTTEVQPWIEVAFNLDYAAFLEWMENEGFIPLPPYIARKEALPAPQSQDRDRYQTIYAREKGSVAAPTAGLHFNAALWQQLQAAGVIPVPLTLHVGGGTFLPVKSDEIAAHAMHRERYCVSRESWTLLERAQAAQQPIVVVGTTSLRCLESFARRTQEQKAEELWDRWQETDLYLYPKTREERIKPWGISGIITNFHQPESSLLMLVSALVGYDETQRIYHQAIEERYRFFSYGDASLLFLS